MAARRLLMRRLRELFRPKYEAGLSHRAIAKACTVGLGVVKTYLRRAAAAGLSWPLPTTSMTPPWKRAFLRGPRCPCRP
jgi:transposase